MRRTDGQAAAELYDYLKSETDYPVDDLLRALLPVQPLAAMAQNLHWHYILPQTAGECAPILLDANTLAKGCTLQPDASTACRCRVLPGWRAIIMPGLCQPACSWPRRQNCLMPTRW